MNFLSYTQVQYGMGCLINMQKSVYLALYDDYEVYSSESLYIESISAIKSENLVSIAKFLA